MVRYQPAIYLLAFAVLLASLIAVFQVWVRPWMGPPQVNALEKPPVHVDISFVSTPHEVVQRMMEMAEIRKDDLVVDLGCGDGRMPIAAAQQFGCRAIGYEIDPRLVRLAQWHVRDQGLEQQVQIVEQDIFTVDLSDVDVLLLFLSDEMNERLIPQFDATQPGTRIVTQAFQIPGILPDSTEIVVGRDQYHYTLYRYTVPLRRKADDRSASDAEEDEDQ